MRVEEIRKRELKDIKEQAQAYANIDGSELINGFNASSVIEEAEDGYFTYLRDEYGEGFIDEHENVWRELLAEFRSEFVNALKKRAKEKIEGEFKDGYKTVGLVLGVQHIHTPYKYYPTYEILSEHKLGEGGLKEVLEERGVAPHAWGVWSNYNNWGNYWFIALTPENYKEEIEGDLDVALAVLADYPELFVDEKDE